MNNQPQEPTPPTPAGTQGELDIVERLNAVADTYNDSPLMASSVREAASTIATLTARVEKAERQVAVEKQLSTVWERRLAVLEPKLESAERDRDAAQARLAVVEGALKPYIAEHSDDLPNRFCECPLCHNARATLSPAPGSDTPSPDRNP